MDIVRLILSIIIWLSFSLSLPIKAAGSKCNDPVVPLIDLVAQPKKFLGKKVVLKGEFNSFSTLALDYPKAMRSSKDYIGLVLDRPDHTEIPLVELKLAVPLKMFQDNTIELENGKKVLIRGKVFAVALGEPWIDVNQVEIIENNNG